jgi:hypothetical protein
MAERPPIMMARVGDNLVPLDDLARQEVAAFPARKPIKVRASQPRSIPRHRLYWAALELVRENMDNPPTTEILHKAVKIRLGYSHLIAFKDGSQAIVDGSVAFDKMTDAEHAEFFERFADLVETTLIPGIDREAFTQEARAMLAPHEA